MDHWFANLLGAHIYIGKSCAHIYIVRAVCRQLENSELIQRNQAICMQKDKKNQSMSVAQVDYQAAEDAINIKNLFHSSLLLVFADQLEHPLRSSTNWERATNFSLQSPEQSSSSWLYINVWVVLQHVSEKSQPTPIKLMFLDIRFFCKRKKKIKKPLNKQN